jgi:hypothetical protein
MNTRSPLQRKPTSSSTPASIGLLHRKSAYGNSASLNEKCNECENKPLTLQRRSINRSTPDEVPPIVHEVLNSSGQPLDADTLTFMESRFGHNFSQVRIHTNAKASASAQAVNALAYTVGRDVVFGSGQYAPKTSDGKQLLAHELTHVVQQLGRIDKTISDKGFTASVAFSQTDERFEQEAEQVAHKVISSQGHHQQPVTVFAAENAPPFISRQPDIPAQAEQQTALEQRLRSLAARPREAISSWRKLKPAEKSFVLMVMGGKYGVDFAQEFHNYATGKKKANLSVLVSNSPNDNPKSLNTRGYRYFGNPAGTAVWVHPSGHEVYLLSLATKSTEQEEDDEDMDKKCGTECQENTENEDECDDCCNDKFPEQDSPCQKFCKAGCAFRI